MTQAHNPKDGWSALTNDPTWPDDAPSASGRNFPNVVADCSTSATGEIPAYAGAGLCPKVPEESLMPGVRLPVFVGGHDGSRESKWLEKAIVEILRRLEVVEVAAPPLNKFLGLEQDIEKLVARVAELESHVAWAHSQAWQPATAPEHRGPPRVIGPLGPMARIPDGEEDCE